MQHQAHRATVDLRHRNASEVTRPRRVSIAVHTHDQPARPAGGQVVDATTCHQLAVVDDRHRLAQILDEIELVAGEHHTTACNRSLNQYLADVIDPAGIK